MKKEYESLFTPWKIGNVTIKNRIVMCPMGGTSLFGWMQPSTFNKVAADLFLERAKNDVGLIIPGIAPLRDSIGGKWLYKNKKAFEELAKYMEEFHKTGAKMFVQLTAGFGRSYAINKEAALLLKYKALGAIAKPILDVSYLTASPSVLPSRWDPELKCREMTRKEINEIVFAYAETSRMLKEAGVDGVEVHAVHEGYLLDQFTLKYTNFRKDEYGGSFENRYRFPVEVVQAIKKACGDDFPVSLRYSVISKTKGFEYGALPGETDYIEVGRDMEESIKAAKYLEEAGYDMLNADNGTYDAWYWAHPPVYMPYNCNLEDCVEIKKHVKIPVVCAGKMQLDVASRAIQEGKIDAMGVARQFLTDGAWVNKVINDKEEDIMPCIQCHNGCFALCKYKGVPNTQSLHEVKQMSRCALNPTTMTGDKYKLTPAKEKKHVVIIGGGIGGMEAARVAKLRGHDVTIYEKSDRLGGVFNEAANFDFKVEDKKLIEWYKRQMKNLEIEIKYNEEIKDFNLLSYDELIIATGAKEKTLNIPGIDKAISALDYLKDKEKVGNRVVVIGGGLTGCEIAYDLHLKGKTPVIVEMLNDLMAVKGLCLANSSFLRDYFKTNNVEVYLESTVRQIKEDELVVVDKAERPTNVKFDSIIYATGYTPNPLTKETKNVHVIGDSYKVGNLKDVIWRAYEVAMNL